MSFSVGIVGLPNSGKSTLFKALTGKQVDIKDYPFTTINPNIGTVLVPDKRLKIISEIANTRKTTQATIEFIDIAGLIRNAHKGEGLGNQFLAEIRNVDTIVQVIRAFRKDDIEHVEKSIDPERDNVIIRTELLMKDMEILERTLDKLKTQKDAGKEVKIKLTAAQKIKNGLLEKVNIDDINLTEEEQEKIGEFQLLCLKPVLYILNIGAPDQSFEFNLPHLAIDLKYEAELSEMPEKEQEELNADSLIDRLIVKCYDILDLISFFTIAGGKEAKAWTAKRGSDCEAAALKVHSDFGEKFKKAEIIGFQELVNAGSWQKAKDKGMIKTAGKEHAVQDGDIIEFKI